MRGTWESCPHFRAQPCGFSSEWSASQWSVSPKTCFFKMGMKNICLAWLYPHLGKSKPEEGRPAGSVTGNDITAPPNKELPPSPEKKTKVGTEWWVIFSCYHLLEPYLLLLLLEPWMKFPFSELLVVLPQFWTFLENILYSYFTIVT